MEKVKTVLAYGNSDYRLVVSLLEAEGWVLYQYTNQSPPGTNMPHYKLVFKKLDDEFEES